MSFIGNPEKGITYAPGWFLADNEDVERKTRQIKQDGAVTADNGGKYVPMGTVYPSNDGKAEGIVYEDVDVTTGDMPGSVVVRGVVYKDRLPKAIDSAAETALKGKGFIFIENAPKVTRPY